MSKNVSIWTLKKWPMQDVTDYIEENSSTAFQARMVNMSNLDYEQLSRDAARDKLAKAISQMNDETYTEYLLELIDE